MRLIHRWLAGEIVDNHVGIKVRGGPFDGRTRIMQLDEMGNPPSRTRSTRAGQTWYVYLLAADPDEPSTWAYVYQSEEPADS